MTVYGQCTRRATSHAKVKIQQWAQVFRELSRQWQPGSGGSAGARAWDCIEIGDLINVAGLPLMLSCGVCIRMEERGHLPPENRFLCKQKRVNWHCGQTPTQNWRTCHREPKSNPNIGKRKIQTFPTCWTSTRKRGQKGGHWGQWGHHGKVAKEPSFQSPEREKPIFSLRSAWGGGKGCSILLLSYYFHGV